MKTGRRRSSMPRSKASGEIIPADTCISDLWPPEVQRNESLFGLPSLGHFVTAALTNKHTFPV